MEGGVPLYDVVWQIPRSVMLALLNAGSELRYATEKLHESANDINVETAQLDAVSLMATNALNNYNAIARQG